MSQTADLGRPHHFGPADTNHEGPVATMLVLHGAGGDEHSLVSMAQAIAPGAAVLSPRGALSAEDGATHLRRGPDGAIDPDEARRTAQELAEFVTGASEAYDLGPTVWCVGFGEGAAAGAALAVEHPHLVDGGVFLSGMAPFVVAEKRMLGGKGAFCAWGRRDEQVSLEEYEALVELLLSTGAEVVLRWYDVGHETSAEELDDAARWFASRQHQRES